MKTAKKVLDIIGISGRLPRKTKKLFIAKTSRSEYHKEKLYIKNGLIKKFVLNGI